MTDSSEIVGLCVRLAVVGGAAWLLAVVVAGTSGEAVYCDVTFASCRLAMRLGRYQVSAICSSGYFPPQGRGWSAIVREDYDTEGPGLRYQQVEVGKWLRETTLAGFLFRETSCGSRRSVALVVSQWWGVIVFGLFFAARFAPFRRQAGSLLGRLRRLR